MEILFNFRRNWKNTKWIICKIKYNIDGKSLTYNVHQIWSSVKTNLSSCDNNVLSNFYGRNYVNCFKTITSSQKDSLCNQEKTKIDVFQKYVV